MCQFFSFVTYKGKPYYLNSEKRKKLLSKGIDFLIITLDYLT